MLGAILHLLPYLLLLLVTSIPVIPPGPAHVAKVLAYLILCALALRRPGRHNGPPGPDRHGGAAPPGS